MVLGTICCVAYIERMVFLSAVQTSPEPLREVLVKTAVGVTVSLMYSFPQKPKFTLKSPKLVTK